jgi:hypothetical protein
MQRGVQPITTGVAGKDPSGSITAVSRRGQPDNQQLRIRVAESRNRAAPVFLSGKFPFPNSRNLAAVGPKPGTQLARGNPVCQAGKGRRRCCQQVGP